MAYTMGKAVDIYSDRTHAGIGLRLKMTRELLGVSQVDFAVAAGLKAAMMSRCENGDARLSVDAANLLCDRFDLTLDWIFRGHASALDFDIADGIKQADNARRRLIGAKAVNS